MTKKQQLDLLQEILDWDQTYLDFFDSIKKGLFEVKVASKSKVVKKQKKGISKKETTEKVKKPKVGKQKISKKSVFAKV